MGLYRHIILPMLQPVTLSAMIILGHMSLKIFDLIVALGRKDLRLDVPGIYMWTTTFEGRTTQGPHRSPDADCGHPGGSLPDLKYAHRDRI
jgi:ABC-type sugar transport system permease subunit